MNPITSNNPQNGDDDQQSPSIAQNAQAPQAAQSPHASSLDPLENMVNASEGIKDTLTSINKKMILLTKSVAFERKEVAKWQDKCKDMEAKWIALENENEMNKNKLSTLCDEKKVLNMKVKGLEGDLELFEQQKTAEISAAQIKVKKFEEKVNMMEQQMLTSKGKLERLQGILKGKDEEIDILRNLLKEAQKSRDHYYVQANKIFDDGNHNLSKKRKFNK